MTKREKEAVKDYEKLAVAVYLSELMKQDLDNDGENAGHRGNDGAGAEQALPPSDPLESAVVYYHPSLVGYLDAALRLLRQAFFRKERKDLFLVGRVGESTTV